MQVLSIGQLLVWYVVSLYHEKKKMLFLPKTVFYYKGQLCWITRTALPSTTTFQPMDWWDSKMENWHHTTNMSLSMCHYHQCGQKNNNNKTKQKIPQWHCRSHSRVGHVINGFFFNGRGVLMLKILWSAISKSDQKVTSWPTVTYSTLLINDWWTLSELAL